MDEIIKNKIKCFCINRIKGCEWIGLLKELCENHIYNCIFKQDKNIINNEILGRKHLNKESKFIDLNVIELSDDDNKNNKKHSKNKKRYIRSSSSDFSEEIINLGDTPPRIINLIDD